MNHSRLGILRTAVHPTLAYSSCGNRRGGVVSHGAVGPRHEASRIDTLSRRERQVLAGAASGLIDKELAKTLDISVHTLKSYWKRIRMKLGHISRGGLVNEWTLANCDNGAGTCETRDAQSFSYSVAHDLREPLRVVGGMAQVLHDELRPSLNAEHEALLQRVMVGCHRMSTLIESHLTLARITGANASKEWVDLTDLALDVVSELRMHYRESEPTIVVEAGLGVNGDEGMLRLLLTNLIDNSLKFSARRIDARIMFGQQTFDGENVFFLSDNGIGFDPSSSPNIFDPFERIQSDPSVSGNGIGLAICDRIVRRHGGRIWAQSQSGHGTTIFFTLSSPHVIALPNRDARD